MNPIFDLVLWLRAINRSSKKAHEHLLSLLRLQILFHENLIKNLALKNWDFCEQAIEQLMGKWGGEVDTFYQDLLTRVQDLKAQTLPDNWTPVIHKQ